MFTTELRVGRLYEHRLGTLQVEAELEALALRGREVMQQHGGKVVVIADYRRVKFVKAELVTKFIEFLSNANPNVERSGVWIDAKNGIFNVQFNRMVREANNPMRRVFEKEEELRAFLADALTPMERLRLEQFMHESVPENF